MNNNSIPGWDFENDTCLTNQRKLIGPDQQELVELLWQNGQVVMQNQTHRKPLGNSSNMRVHVQKTDQSTLRSSGPYGNSTNLDQEEEAPSWIQFPLEDPLEHDCCSNLLSELPPYKPIRQLEEEKFANFFATTTSSSQPLPPNMKSSCVQGLQGNPILMPAPRFHVPDSSQKINDFVASRKVLNFPHFSTPLNNVSSAPGSTQFREKTTANLSQSEAREYSVITVGSSHCGSNHIPQEQDVSMVSSSGVWATTNNTTLSAEPEAVRDCVQRPICPRSDKDKGKSEMIEPTVTSSSGGSGSTGNGRTFSLSTRDHGRKRKATEEEASEEQSEATELKSADGNKASQRTGSSRRNRASEVHNQSERRRRDRINEKMRTLQQLIPNSNKTDKASMLEEAIEYLKSLQFQLQVMWMGAGMTHTPVLFPGIQHYMPQMGMGMGAASIHQLPKVTSHDQQAMPNHQNLMCQNSIMSTFNYQNHQCHIPEQYARYMGYHLMQTTSQHQAMNNNVLRYGSHSEAQGVQHSQTMIAAGNNSSGPMTGTANNNIDELVPVSAKAGSSTFNT